MTTERAADAGAGRDERDALASQVARLFFERQLTKVEIAARLGISRFRVARLLDQALADGLVRIEFRDTPAQDRDLAGRIRARFRLSSCLVAAADADEAAVARLGAAELDGIVGRRRRDRHRLGVDDGPGRAERARPRRRHDRRGPAGGQLDEPRRRHGPRRPGPDPGGAPRRAPPPAPRAGVRRVEPSSGPRSCASRTSPPPSNASTGWPSPSSASARSAGRTGRPAPRSCGRARSDPTRSAGSAALGAVGDLIVHPFTADGRFVAPDLAERAIAISIDQLRRVPAVIAVAAGPAKVAAIRGALQTGVVASLVTDAATGPIPGSSNEAPRRPGLPRDRVDRDGGRGGQAAGRRGGARLHRLADGRSRPGAGRTRSSRPAATRAATPAATAWAAADLTDEAAVDAAVAGCVERFGRIDGLFSVAGGSGRRFGDGPMHTRRP